MRICYLLALGLAFIASLPLSAFAAEITKHENDSRTLTAVFFQGPIESGDLFKLQTYLSKQPKKRTTAVYFDSPGGNLYEGLKIGRFLHKAKIKSVIEGVGGSCLSACALAFLGGRDPRSGSQWRAKSSSSKLGFHSFRRSFQTGSTYSAADMERATQDAQDIVLEIADYLREIGTGLEFLRIMFRARSDQMNYVTNEEALMIGIIVWDEAGKEIVRPLGDAKN